MKQLKRIVEDLIEEIFNGQMSTLLVGRNETLRHYEFLLYDELLQKAILSFSIKDASEEYNVYRVVTIDTIFFANYIDVQRWIKFLNKLEGRELIEVTYNYQ